jgi:very-short-patch-repair endonuclease
MTDAERRLWRSLRRKNLGHKFRRQAPVGPYILDFVCLERKVVVEVDGGQHSDNAEEAARDSWLEEQGFKVLRFWNREVLTNLEGVVQAIQLELGSPPPRSSPTTRGEEVRGTGGDKGGSLFLFAILGLALAVPAQARVASNYGPVTKTVRACILTPTGLPTQSASPYVFYLLGSNEVSLSIPNRVQGEPPVDFRFYPPKPPGFEFVNPLAEGIIAKSDPAYWTFGVSLLNLDFRLLENFDIVLLPAPFTAPTVVNQMQIARWMERGGLLWIDRQQGMEGSTGLWLETAVQFPAFKTLLAEKRAADENHGLLRGLFQLSRAELQRLGVQRPYSENAFAASYLFGTAFGTVGMGPFGEQLLLQAVVNEKVGDVELPSVSCGRFGKGGVVVTACGVAQAISDWYQRLLAGNQMRDGELPEWSLPDFKLAYNIVEWARGWASGGADARQTGEAASEITGPLSLRWSFAVAAHPRGPVVDRGVAFFGDGAGNIHALDAKPQADLDSDGQSDDGVEDFRSGGEFDRLWSVNAADLLGQGAAGWEIVGSPAADRASIVPGVQTPVVAAAVRSRDGLDSQVLALRAKTVPFQGQRRDWPAGAEMYWTADLSVRSRPPTENLGKLNSGPVASERMFFLATSDTSPDTATPHRNAHIIAMPAAGGASQVQVSLAATGIVAECFSPPAVAYIEEKDEVTGVVAPVQVVVTAINSLPRVSAAAAGRVLITPLMVRFPAPNWNQAWLFDPSLPDAAANQSVQVLTIGGQQIPPHAPNPQTGADDGTGPLNYIRNRRAGQMEIIFTRWSIFSPGRFPQMANQIHINYMDNRGVQRTVSQRFHAGLSYDLAAAADDSGQASPCVVGNTAYVPTKSVPRCLTVSAHGTVAAVPVQLVQITGAEWKFPGDVTGGIPARTATGREFFTDFSFTPANSGDTLYAAGNYSFSADPASPSAPPMPMEPSGSLYALDLKANRELVDPDSGNPVLPLTPGYRLSPRAPVGLSADPNQTPQENQRGSAIWLSASMTSNLAQFAIPQRTGADFNWTPDYQNAIIRLGPGAFGRYAGSRLRVRYFEERTTAPYDIIGPVEKEMQANPLVKWAFHFAALDPRTGQEAAVWRIISPPAAGGGAVHVAVVEKSNRPTNGQIFIVSFPERVAGQRPPNPYWVAASGPGTAVPHWVFSGCSAQGEALFEPADGAGQSQWAAMALSGDQVLMSTPGGQLQAFRNESTLVADGHRIVDVRNGPDPANLPAFTYFMHADGSLLRTPPDHLEAERSTVASSTGALWASFVTKEGEPTVLFTRPGPWRFVFVATGQEGSRVRLFFRVFAGGASLLFETGQSQVISSTPSEYVLDHFAPGFVLSPGDRIYVEVYAIGNGSVKLHLEGTTGSRIQTPITGAGSSHRVRRALVGLSQASSDDSLNQSLDLPKSDSYADRALTGLSRPSRARRLANGNLLIADTGMNRVVEADSSGMVVWQYPDSDAANVEIASLFPDLPDVAKCLRTPTPESERLLAPTDVKRFVQRASLETLYKMSGQPEGDFQVEWVTTIIADSGNSRIVEVLRPLVDGRYRPDLMMQDRLGAPLQWSSTCAARYLPQQPTTPEGIRLLPLEQTVRLIGPDLGLSRPLYYHQDGQSLKAIRPPAQLIPVQATVAPGPQGQIMAAFFTAPGEVGEIPAGVWAFNFMASAQTTAPTTAHLFFKVYVCDADGNPVGGALLQTSASPAILQTGERYVVTTFLGSAASLAATQRLCVQVWGLSFGGASSDITFFYQGETGSRVAIPVGSFRGTLAFNTVERSADPAGYFSTMLMAGCMNHPPDPMRTILGSADPFVGLVNIALGYDDLGRLRGASIVSRVDGINIFRPRQGTRDLMHVRQADRVRRLDATGQPQELALVVDSEGIRLLNGVSWNLVDPPAPVLEFNAPDYAREMQGMHQLHPDLAYASEGAQRFFPASVQLLAGNRMLILNSEPSPLQQLTAQEAPPGPQKSEVFEVDFNQEVGWRIFRPDGGYFIVPDPFSAAYPALAGFSYSLREPLWAER